MSDERENKSLMMKPDERCDIVVESITPRTLTLDCGEYGKLELVLVINGRACFTAGNKAPQFIFDRPEADGTDADYIIHL